MDKNANGVVDVTNTASNEILQENHFYPFGLNMAGPWMNDAVQDNLYKYNGKELNGDFGLNWMDYGARWYDGALGRWWSVDLMANKYSRWSPYNYGIDNPVIMIDPDGRDIIIGYSKDMNSKERKKYEKAILSLLSSLTDDELNIKKGKVVIKKKSNGGKRAGTALIREFVDGFVKNGTIVKRDVSIVKSSDNPKMDNATTIVDPNGNPKDASNGIGTDSKIAFDPDNPKGTEYYPEGANEKTNAPSEMVLVHELVHARRIALGKRDTSPCANCKKPSENPVRAFLA